MTIELTGEYSLGEQLDSLSGVLDSLLSATSPTDLCRSIVHAGYTPPNTRGCHLYYLDNLSNLRPIAGYGIGSENGTDLSAWDDSPLSEAVREKRMVIQELETDNGAAFVVAVPLLNGNAPTGLLALYTDGVDRRNAFDPDVVKIFGKLGAFYLETLDFGRLANGTGPINLSPADLTTRQLTILGHIEEGMINLEIAKVLMLSESTIRQETVRIYRALGVGNRQEAIKKAKALGLLPKRPISQAS